jgi:hypothetical protein
MCSWTSWVQNYDLCIIISFRSSIWRTPVPIHPFWKTTQESTLGPLLDINLRVGNAWALKNASRGIPAWWSIKPKSQHHYSAHCYRGTHSSLSQSHNSRWPDGTRVWKCVQRFICFDSSYSQSTNILFTNISGLFSPLGMRLNLF